MRAALILVLGVAAHAAGAQWLLWLDGKKDWEVHGYPTTIQEK